MATRRSKPRRLWPFLIVALAGHGLGVGGAMVYEIGAPLSESHDLVMGGGVAGDEQITPIDLDLIEPTVINELADRPTEEQAAAELAKKAEEARKAEESPDTPGQVVDIAKPQMEMRPDDARFLSEYDSKVEKESRSRGAPGPLAPPAPKTDKPEQREEAQPTPPVPPQQAQQAQPAQTPGHPGALAMRDPGKGPEKTEKAETVGAEKGEHGPTTDDGLGAQAGKSPNEQPPTPDKPGGAPGTPGAGDGKPLPSLAELRPTDETLRSAMAGGGGSLDALSDVDDGAETLLNTKRFRYASFFNRVKHAVAQSWHPDDAYRLRDPSGRIYGIKARRTTVRVSLRPDGTLEGARVEKASGVDFLDDEAVNALRAAQPFPNPPQGLVDGGSKLITFRFEFNFEIMEAPSFRVFRN